jgi:invasion protein IalB
MLKLHLKLWCLLLAGLAALAAGLVRLASTALAAVMLHAAAVAPTSPAHLSLLVWISVCAEQDMA